MYPLSRSRVLGRTYYVLDPVLHDSGDIPKCQPKSLQRKFVFLSSKHASNYSNILNLKT